MRDSLRGRENGRGKEGKEGEIRKIEREGEKGEGK